MTSSLAGQLDEIIRRLVAELDPDRVMLFGSHAWGHHAEDSDVDLLVIIPETKEPSASRAARAHRCLRGIPLAMDLIVKTRQEMDRFGGVAGSLEAEILSRGKVLYGRSETRARAELAPQGRP